MSSYTEPSQGRLAQLGEHQLDKLATRTPRSRSSCREFDLKRGRRRHLCPGRGVRAASSTVSA
jgi:hypothetical protein